MLHGNWCTSLLKSRVFGKRYLRKNVLSHTDKEKPSEARPDKRFPRHPASEMVHKAEDTMFLKSSLAQGANTNFVQYLGISADEPVRIERHTRPGVILPLVDIGWDSKKCRSKSEEIGLLSPIYTSAARGGCWFCHNQSTDQLRQLRKNYPELWSILMQWDSDSPVTFKADGHTVHDFDRRFALEDAGIITPSMNFKWKMLDDDIQLKLY